MRYLKARQVFGRAVFKIRRASPDNRPAPALRLQPDAGRWIQPPLRHPSLVGPQSWQLLGVQRDLADIGWDADHVPLLWRYNQHYFYDLVAADSTSRESWHRALIERWMLENPPARGTGWHPYPVSLRVVNWIKWIHQRSGAQASGECLPAEFMRAVNQSLATQARWLTKRLEWHLLGNHLFANAKALVFAGLHFDGDESDGWLRSALRILDEQCSEQLLADGGHFERSPMYHALALEDVLDLVNIADTYQGVVQAHIIAGWRSLAASMLSFLNGMSHPDGEISLFNDSAFGVAPEVSSLGAYAARLGVEPVFKGVRYPAGGVQCDCWPDSGYLRLSTASARLFLDCGPIGPDYLPGHAHADSLGCELSVYGHRVLVDSGVSLYEGGAERLRQRGTAAHNTVVIDDQDSSEVWSSFRVARRARCVPPTVEAGTDALQVECAHDGYRWLPGRPRHSRRWLIDQTRIRITDRVDGEFQSASARFHVAPQWTVQMEGLTAGRLTHDGGSTVVFAVRNGRVRLEPSTYHPTFGACIPNSCVCVDLVDGWSEIEFRWRPVD